MMSGLLSLISNLSGRAASLWNGIVSFEIPLAYRPFLDPIQIDRYWILFLPPLILVIALVYRTIKTETLDGLPGRAGYLAFQISLFMILAAATLWLTLLIF